MLAAVDKASMRAKDLTLQLLTFSKGGSPIKKVIDDIDVLIKDTTPLGYIIKPFNEKEISNTIKEAFDKISLNTI